MRIAFAARILPGRAGIADRFLIRGGALAIIVPVSLSYTSCAGLEAERIRAFASSIAGFFLPVRQFAIYRARRYRLTRTVWARGAVWMSGRCPWARWRAPRAALCACLMILTLG